MMGCQKQYFIKVFQKCILVFKIELKYKLCMILIHKYYSLMIKDEAKNRKNKAYTTFGSMAPISNNALKSYPIMEKQ